MWLKLQTPLLMVMQLLPPLPPACSQQRLTCQAAPLLQQMADPAFYMKLAGSQLQWQHLQHQWSTASSTCRAAQLLTSLHCHLTGCCQTGQQSVQMQLHDR
jgi:hypothetical protein